MASAAANSTQILEDDIISLEEIKMWTIEARKDYCRRRGFKTGGSSEELSARVYVLYNQQVPENPTAVEELQSRKVDYVAIYKEGPGSAVDPNRLKKWIPEKEGISFWPQTTYIEIVKFIQKKGCSLSKDALTSYKTGKAYSLFYNDYIQEVFLHTIRKEHPCCFLKAQCRRSNKVNDPPHEVWVKIIKESGEVCSAYCTCFAGLSQVCNHAAAILFKIESAHRLDISNPSCTTAQCSWKVPALKDAVYIQLQDMEFSKPGHQKGKVKSLKKSAVPATQFRQYLTKKADSLPYQEFIQDLKASKSDAVIFLPGSENISPEENIGDDVIKLAAQSHSIDAFLDKLKLTGKQLSDIEVATRGQSDNPLWKAARAGRLTASNFYRIHTRVETLKTDPHTDMANIVQSILNPPDLGHLSQIISGKSLEKEASEHFVTQFRQKHNGAVFTNCGLFIDEEMSYLGASPDGIIECTCHGKALVEIKCPSKLIADLNYLDSHGKLKRRNNYFGQIQGQMMVTGVSVTYFYVYRTDESSTDVIPIDKQFTKSLRSNLHIFYTQFIAPYLLSQPSTKTRKLV